MSRWLLNALVWHTAFTLLPRATTDTDDVCAGGLTNAECSQLGPTWGRDLAPGWGSQTVPASPGIRLCREVLGVLPQRPSKVWERMEPGVLGGVAEAAAWDTSAFGRERLRDAYGATRVGVFSPAQAALLGGQSSRVHPIRRVLQQLRDPGRLPYVFDQKFFQDSQARRAVKVPKWLEMGGGELILTMGGPLSGAGFHAHGAAFLTLLAGQKQWYLHPPGSFPNASARALHRDVANWSAEVLPALVEGGEAPLSCVQEPGETVFVPDSWAHATMNLGETVGVAWQRTTTRSNSCSFGMDYMCLQQSLVTAATLSPAAQPPRFRELFGVAEEVTAGQPYGLLRHLAPYWRSSGEEGRKVFRKHKARVVRFFKEARRNSDDEILAAALVKALVDVIFEASGDVAEASKLLRPAARRVPEAGLGVSVAQLLGKQGRWSEAVEHLELHLIAFPDDTTASTMLAQAREFAKQ